MIHSRIPAGRARLSAVVFPVLASFSLSRSSAQTAQAPAAAPAVSPAVSPAGETVKLAEFTVTGTNIRRLDVEKVLPVTVFNREAIEVRNPSTPVEMLQSLPQVTGSSTNEFGPSAISGRGDAASLNLRGIGDGNTLILLDGMRMPPRAIIQGLSLPNNVNALPTRGIDRIEVLRDGASSIYGADATAGVVNFVTKRDYTGTELIFRSGITAEGDGQTAEGVVTHGLSFAKGRGNLLSTWSFLYRNAIYFRDREFTRSDDRSALAPAPWNIASGPFNTRSAVGFWPTFVIGTATTTNTFRPVNGVPTLTAVAPNRVANPEFYADIQGDYFSQPRTTRLSLYEKLTFKLSEKITAFSDYYFYRATSRVLRNPMFSTNGSEGRVTMSADNPYNPYGSRFYDPAGLPNADGTPRLAGAARTIGISDYMLPGYGAQQTDVDSQIYRVVGGVSGTLGQTWNWKAAATYGGSHMLEVCEENVYIPAYRDALLRTDATAYNPFGYTFKVQGGAVVVDRPYLNPTTVLRGMEQPFINRGFADISTALLNANGELFTLFDRTVSLAAGSEYRRESYRVSRDAPSLPTTRTHLTGAALPPSSGSRNVFSLYAETVVPIVRPESHLPLMHSIELSASARFEDYSDFGTDTNPKYSVNWKPTSWMMVRGSYNEGFFAPSLPALYQGQVTANTVNQVDLYRNPATNEGSYRSNATTGSNPGLRPELSEGRSAGVVVEVPWVRGLSLSADYWQIRQQGILGSFSTVAINQVDTQLLVAETQRQLAAGTSIANVDLGSGAANYRGDPRVTRLPPTAADRAAFAAYNTGRPAAQQLGVVGQLFGTRVLTENRSEGHASGVDLGLTYRLPALALGRITLSSNAAYLIDSYTVADPGGPRIQRMMRNGAARWRGDASVFWRKEAWNAALSAYYIGGLVDTGASTTAAIYESLGSPNYIARTFDNGQFLYLNTIGSSISYNFTLGYAFKDQSRWLQGTRARLAVNNLFNRAPPLTAGGFTASNQQNLLAGRAFSLELTREF